MNDTERLQAFFAARLQEPHRWGRSDCAILAFDAAALLVGRDLVAHLRGTYSTAAGALRIIRRHGGLRAMADRYLGAEIPAAQAGPGSVALLASSVCTGQTSECGALGVAWCGGVVAQGATGLVVVPAERALCWWEVPRG